MAVLARRVKCMAPRRDSSQLPEDREGLDQE